MFCREQVAQLRGQEPEIEKRGARLAVVGNGAPTFIAGFRKTTGFQGTLLTDPSLESYKAAAWQRGGCLGLLSPRVLGAGLRSLRAGFRQGRTQGDPFQNGGVIVVRAPDRVLYRYASRFSGDHPDPAAILAALA